MIHKWYLGLENKFPDIKCHEMIIMPNHLHCVLEIHSGEYKGSPLHSVIQWFKTMTTNDYIKGVKNDGWEAFDKKRWQRNYYEHVIRNEASYLQISEYI